MSRLEYLLECLALISFAIFATRKGRKRQRRLDEDRGFEVVQKDRDGTE